MSRPILIVDIGDAGLPVVTPVEPRAASWVPTPYIAPPPPAPSGLAAESVSDGVLLTWSHPGGRGIEFRVERAPDIAGAPGTWMQVGQPLDTRYTFTTPADKVDGCWFRVRAVRNGRYSEFTSQVFQWPYASNPPMQELVITNSTITIDCRYTRFNLLLDQDVEYVGFINVPPSKTVLIYVTQFGGGHLLLFPSWVRPVNNVPYIASPVAGSTDIVGLDTDNAGIDWALVAQQPAGGGSAFAVTAWPSPAYTSVFCTSVEPASPSIKVTSEQVNGTSPVLCDWSRIDGFGGDDFRIDDRSTPAPTFSIPSGTTGVDVAQVWRVTYSDSTGRNVSTTVTIRLVRTVVASEDISTRLLNPGFEEGDTGWDKGPSCAIVMAGAYSGLWSLQLNRGLYGESETVNRYIADVREGQMLTARCMIHQGASDAGRAGGWVRIIWFRQDRTRLSHVDGNNVDSGSGGAQYPSTISRAIAPADAYHARLAIVIWRNGQNHEVNADDATWARLS